MDENNNIQKKNKLKRKSCDKDNDANNSYNQTMKFRIIRSQKIERQFNVKQTKQNLFQKLLASLTGK